MNHAIESHNFADLANELRGTHISAGDLIEIAARSEAQLNSGAVPAARRPGCEARFTDIEGGDVCHIVMRRGDHVWELYDVFTFSASNFSADPGHVVTLRCGTEVTPTEIEAALPIGRKAAQYARRRGWASAGRLSGLVATLRSMNRQMNGLDDARSATLREDARDLQERADALNAELREGIKGDHIALDFLGLIRNCSSEALLRCDLYDADLLD